MDKETREKQIFLESHVPESNPYEAYWGQKVFCPHCNEMVKILENKGMRNADPAEMDFTEVFTTSCQHRAFGEISPYDSEWNFWIE
jgi:hypothetical protein